ncbi:unnamed protein product, partial [Musa textilis]
FSSSATATGYETLDYISRSSCLALIVFSDRVLLFLCSFESVIMSDEEHHFESKADAGASKTYPQQAGTIRKNGYIVIKGRACKVVEVSTSKTGKHGHAKCHFVGIDIFNTKKLEDIVPSSHNCDVPHVTRTDYQLIDISEDGFVSLLTENGNTKDDLRLPTDETLLAQVFITRLCFSLPLDFSQGLILLDIFYILCFFTFIKPISQLMMDDIWN